MRALWRASTVVLGISLSAGALHTCAGDNPTEPSSSSTEPTATLSTAHFDIRVYDGLAQEVMDAVADRIEAEHGRITGDLRVSAMPRVRVGIWGDQDSFYRAMAATIGTVYTGATGYVLGPTGFSLLATGDPSQTAVHEFAHVVTLNINEDFANNPRWLWEAVAIYEAEEFYPPSTLAFMGPGNFPTLEQINAEYNQGGWIYQVGYVLTEYIVETWGMDAVISLIESNGDLEGDLGITVTEFERGWHAWLTEQYF